MLALLPVFGLFGCGGSKKHTADEIIMLSTVYYGTARDPVYAFALKKEENGWLFSADCLVGEQKEHYTSFAAFPVPAEDAAELLRIISEDGEIERLKKHRDPIHIFHSSDAPARMSQMTFSDGSTVEKEAAMGERVLAYLNGLADRYYRAAESAADTPADTAMSETTTTLPKQENP